MRNGVIVDTNVAVVANGRTPQANSACVCECISRLLQVRMTGLVLLDAANLILDEYRRNLSPSGQPGTGDMFFKWLWNNQGFGEHCQKVDITPNDERGFDEFPNDPTLGAFDADDRVFVAVAIASGMQPSILNASDPGWWTYRDELEHHGIAVEFLCPVLMTKGD